MNLELSDADRAFQAEVRDFVRSSLPPELAERNRRHMHLAKQDYVTWHRLLNKRGWGAPNWPKEFGGTGWNPVQRYIFDEECAIADAPPLVPFGISMVGPVIYTFGTPAQKAHYLPRILSMEDWWCQGYSEPGSGSDLASLRTRAESDGDDYIVTGHKIWTTQAHFADMMFCLVRTDAQAKPQEGISFLLIDMKTPGITVRPIISIDEGHGVNEVFLDGVRVPKANRIGQEGKGWTYAKFLLGNERTTIAEVSTSKQRLRRLKTIARAEMAQGASLLEDPAFRDKVASVEIELLALEYTNLRVLAAETAGKGVGPEASMLKIRGSEIQQTITELVCEALGYYAAPFEHAPEGSNLAPLGPDYAQGRMESFLYNRATTIYGGSNEIQRNIIAKMVLGL
ncbi:acyl-CoA dehydrogenase family protein [Ferrovibrio sp.]|uniref:acyl-CoA dehydrogenase family protein n=1 Tax=Ferrovibrio sp. TaxID=1917215 RepID=UPI0035AF354A